ncbi:MAG: hypothetical protein L6244_03410 [Candidatus Methanoperedenaceae archaeon]|nr:hypothetical protein [Candidatus Methanoperedenaceae archaeon]
MQQKVMIPTKGLSTFASLIGKLEVAATGFNEFFAKSAGFEIISGKVLGGRAVGEGGQGRA